MTFASRAPKVTVVVLATDGWPETRKCLESLARMDYPSPEIVVVDNGSTDGLGDEIGISFPSVTVLETGTLVGFSRGNNLGIRYALERGSDYVWLLNNDTVVERGALSAAVATAEEDPRIGIVGSALYFDDERDRVQAWGGGTYNPWLGVTTCAFAPTPASELDFITGASMLLRRELLEDIGLLDESFFFYMEDADLCLRARKAGWHLAVAPESVVYHKVGATINAGAQRRSLWADQTHVRSGGIFVGKHAGRSRFLVAPVRLGGIVARRALRRQFGAIPALLREYVRGVRIGRAGGHVPAAPRQLLGNGREPARREFADSADGVFAR